jgi:DnaK suppressor protein
MQVIDKLTRSQLREIEATLRSELERSERNSQPDAARVMTEALERLRDGSYGTCSSCGNQIPAGRLLVIPETTHCLGCN